MKDFIEIDFFRTVGEPVAAQSTGGLTFSVSCCDARGRTYLQCGNLAKKIPLLILINTNRQTNRGFMEQIQSRQLD